MDLLTALPGQTIAEGLAEMVELLSYSPDHVSLYTLTVEPGTRLNRDLESGRIPPQSDGEIAVWEEQMQLLQETGFEQYEISNFALSGCRSRHNMAYWRLEPYLGCGPAAVSTLPGTNGPLRIENCCDIERFNNHYGALSGRGESVEPVSPGSFFLEHLMVGLRLSDGVDRPRLEKVFGVDPVAPIANTLDKWGNMVETDSSMIRLTNAGRLFLDSFLKDAALEIESHTIPSCRWP